MSYEIGDYVVSTDGKTIGRIDGISNRGHFVGVWFYRYSGKAELRCSEYAFLRKATDKERRCVEWD